MSVVDGELKFTERLADYYLKTDDTTGEQVTTNNLNAANAESLMFLSQTPLN